MINLQVTRFKSASKSERIHGGLLTLIDFRDPMVLIPLVIIGISLILVFWTIGKLRALSSNQDEGADLPLPDGDLPLSEELATRVPLDVPQPYSRSTPHA